MRAEGTEGVSERRYVVELTKPVTGTDLTSAAGQIARRLGIDVGRVVTLLKGRVGPVTKPVLAEKADAIAQIFQDAGVDVAVYDADASPDQTVWPREHEVALPVDRSVDAGEDAGVPGDAPDVVPSEYGYEAHAPPLPPDLDRWDADDPWAGMDPWRDAAYEPMELEPVTRPEAPGSTRRGVDEGAPATQPGGEEAAEDRRSGAQWPLPPTKSTSVVRPGVWEPAPAQAAGRGALRGLLLVALAIAVVLFFALQLVYRDRGATAPTYEDGLAAYRVGDFDAARRSWVGAADAGSVESEFMLGHLAQNGLGRPWSFREAAERYAVAAEAGLPEAQMALGELYIEGLGVQPDPEAGMAWLRRAAGSGHGPALLRYGEAALHGEAGERDFDAAISAFEAAAAAGSAKAADYLAFVRHFAETSGMMVP